MLASMRSAPTAMVMVDGEGRIVLANTGAEHLFGHRAEDLLGGPVEVLVPERFRGDHPGSRAGYRDEPGTRPMGAGRDLYGLRADGTEVPIEIGLNPVETDEGLFVLSAIADITERKHLHEEQQRLNDELTAANEALMQSNIDLQQFAHVASHDLQAPLRHIAGFVQLLRDEYLHQLDERADQWIARTLEGVGRMQTMIRELLAYSRVDPRARPFKPVALGRAVDDALELLASSVADSGAEITCDDLPVVIGDGAQIAQLFQNLLSNSIMYHGDNQPRIGIWAESSSTEWIVSVKDNGIGIDREHHDKIFDVFHRLHSEREYPGTGIGLSVCRRIVQRHGGRIWIDPETAEGTVVRFALPLPATG
jgi:PAS domain S-box-containing protein